MSTRVMELGTITSPAAGDFFYIIDVSDTTDRSTGSSKKITVTSLLNSGLITTVGTLTSLLVGSATGGDKGAGTINAVAVYDDNVLLSCYVFDAALDGVINLQKWDSKTPKGHAFVRKFNERFQDEAKNPLNLRNYIQHWKEKRHLTALPNEQKFKHNSLSVGNWVQRFMETLELHAVHDSQLLDMTDKNTSDIEEIKKQLTLLKGENTRLKNKLKMMELGKDAIRKK